MEEYQARIKSNKYVSFGSLNCVSGINHVFEFLTFFITGNTMSMPSSTVSNRAAKVDNATALNEMVAASVRHIPLVIGLAASTVGVAIFYFLGSASNEILALNALVFGLINLVLYLGFTRWGVQAQNAHLILALILLSVMIFDLVRISLTLNLIFIAPGFATILLGGVALSRRWVMSLMLSSWLLWSAVCIALPLEATEVTRGILGSAVFFGISYYLHERRYKVQLRYLATVDELNSNKAILEESVQTLEAKELELKSYQVTLEQQNIDLERASKLKSEFLANMSHELRTPLTAINGFAELLQAELYGDLNDHQKVYVKDIQDSGTHLLSIINDILDLSRVEAGKMIVEREKHHLCTFVGSVVDRMSLEAEEKNIQLALQQPCQFKPLEFDPVRIRQVLMNFLSNALKFTDEGGRIDVCVTDQDGLMRVEVADTGIGIATEDLNKLFKPFSQVDAAMNRQYGGTGLGLAISKRLVELHGGEVWVESKKGQGSRFGFSLPR